ncbi:MAG: helix-turn-helix domain-containing protein, partial [Candidatus Woesearchaeota archaeon]|nr:helix-turn-helix domain-containing protein [Candidatus Woesearchaeota archaeon]
MKTYTTGKAAKICGLSIKTIRRLFDQDQINGHQVQSSCQRRTDRRIPVDSLIKFMRQHNISMDNLVDDNIAQREILYHQMADLRALLVKSKKRSGVFFGFKGLADSLLEVVNNLDPLDNTFGISEDKKRAVILKRMAEIIEKHIKLRHIIAVSKI